MRRIILKPRRLRFVAQTSVLFVFLGSATPAFAQNNQAKVKVGETAPAFILKNQSGKAASLKKLLTQKPAAIVFYRSADW